MSARPARRRRQIRASQGSVGQHRRARFAGYARRLRFESLEDRRLLAVVTVNTDNDVLDGDTSSIGNLVASPGPDGAISLREAITAANITANVGTADEIHFAIPGSGPYTIMLVSALPSISDSVILDASTQPDYSGSPIVTVDALAASPVVAIASGSSTVQGLAIRTSGVAMRVNGGSGNVLTNLDLSWTGTGQSGTGLEVLASSGNVIENVTARNRYIAVDMASGAADNTFQHNDFSSSEWAIHGWYYPGSGNAFLDNDLSYSTNGVAFRGTTGLDVSADSFDFTGIAGTALRLAEVTNSHLAGLDVSWTGTGKSGTGIAMDSSSNNTFEHITASNRATGIYLNSSSDTAIRLSSILNNSTGVSVDGASTGILLNYNDIAGNSQYGVSNTSASNPPTDVVNAEYNYWGAADGPRPIGSGDAITDRVDAIPFLGGVSLTVTNTNDSGPGSLRQAIQTANAQPGLDLIDFAIPGSGPYTISLASALPTISDPVILDGATQPGYAGSPIVEVDGVGTATRVLTVAAGASGSTVRGLAMRTAGVAVALYSAGDVLSNLDLSWTGEGKSGEGIYLESVSGTVFEDITAKNRSHAVELGWGTMNDNVFRHNDFSHSGSWAVYQWYGTAPRNVFLDNDVSYSGGGAVFRNGTEIELWGDSFDFTGIAGTALALYGVTNSHIAGLDVSWTGEGKSGEGIYLESVSGNVFEDITAKNRSHAVELGWDMMNDNIFRHNDFSHSGSWAVYQWYGSAPRNVFLDNDVSYSGGGAVFRNSTEIELWGDSFDFTGIAGTALALYGVTNSHIAGLDVSWTGEGKSGEGIYLESISENVFEDITAQNRTHAVELGWDMMHDNIFRHNDFSHSGSWAVYQWYGSAPRNVFLDNDVSFSGGGVVFRGSSEIEVLGDSFDFTGIAGTALALCAVTNSHIAGLDVSWNGEGKSGTGIVVNASSGNIFENIVARNRNIAIELEWGPINNNAFRHNDLSGSGSWGIEGWYGWGSGNVYQDNDLSDGANGILLRGSTGLEISGASSDFSWIPNTAIGLVESTGVSITDLDVSWTGSSKSGTGIGLQSSTDVTMTGVTVSGRETGIRLENSAAVTLGCTGVLNNRTGVAVSGSSSGIVLNYDQFAGNSSAGLANAASSVVSAESNYWGSPTGPSNLGGSGDSYSGNVDADPFLTRLPACLNSAPVADAGPDQTFEPVGSDETIQVTLDGSGSFDPDGDPIASYTWTGPFPEGGGVAYGVNPTLTLPVGTSTITLVVNDGYADSAPDTVSVVVNRQIWYVDDNGPGDPLPGDPSQSDPLENGSPAHPFDSIQEGIDAASDGHTVLVAAGTYKESLTWDTKDIDVIGAGATETIVDADGSGRCLTITNVPGSATLEGFTFTGGSAANGGGVYLSSSSPTIVNNAIIGNQANSGYSSGGGGIYGYASSAVIVNNTITGNLASPIYGYGGGGLSFEYSAPVIAHNLITANTSVAYGGGIYFYRCSSAVVTNNTLTANSAVFRGGGIFFAESSSSVANNIVAFNSSGLAQAGSAPQLKHNLVYGNTLGDYSAISPGEGDISEDPQFAGSLYGDLHVQPDSPARDAGDDSLVVGPWPDMDGQTRVQGMHVDMGADESDGTVWTVTRPIMHVSTDGNDANDGLSWAQSKQTIAAAIAAVGSSGGEVWVSQGTYHERILLPQHVYLYGGFGGTESSVGERDWRLHTTVIDGEASGTVVSAVGAGHRWSEIDGFTIRNGNAARGAGILVSVASPLIRNNTITGNTANSGYSSGGGGIYGYASSAVIVNNTITGNLASPIYSYGGGGLSFEYSVPVIADNLITANTAVSYGGGIYFWRSSSAVVTNNTLTANSAVLGGGGIYFVETSPSVANNIVAFNSSGLAQAGSAPQLKHNLVYGNTLGDYLAISPGEGDISEDPQFAGGLYGDLHVQPDSPARDAGDDSLVVGPWPDMDGQTRVQGTHVDVGADESDGTLWTITRPIMHVSTEGSDANDGLSWAQSKRTIAAAVAAVGSSGGDVWVSQGTYHERIVLPQHVYLYGGFAGTESSVGQREWRLHTTAIDGEAGGTVVSAVGGGHRWSAIDGFTIRNGNAARGAGILVSVASPLIQNNTITGNTASSGYSSGGGGIYGYASSAVIMNNTITENLASPIHGYGGGGLSFEYSAPVIADNLIAANAAVAYGGGIYFWRCSSAVVTNNTLTANSAISGGGIYFVETSPSVANNIVAFNSSGLGQGGSAPQLKHNLVYGNTSYDYAGLSPGATDISADPLFVNRDAGDFHLRRDSPCFDAGDDGAVEPDWVDLDGQPRIQGAHVDIGADEIAPNTAPVADAGGPYAVVAGLTVPLDGSGSTDPDQPPETLTYQWDLDGDGVFGETGADAARGDEMGITPTFSSAGLSAPSAVTVTLRVTDGDGQSSDDTAPIEIYGADLTIAAGGIVFAPVSPEPGQDVLIMATVVNQGVADSPAAVVKFFAFDDLIGTATVASLAPGQTGQVSIQPAFATAGLRLITVQVDPDDDVRELSEENNEASAVLQVGEATSSDEAEIVVAVPGHTAYQGRPLTIGGRADYDFLTTPQSPDYPVQGAQVTVTVIDSATSQVLGVYTGAKTGAHGNFWQGIWAPVDVGAYTLRVQVTDNTVTGQVDSTLNVIVEPSLPPVPPPTPPGGTARDVSVYSENIFFSENNPDLGEPITIYAFIGYVGQTPADDVTITVNDLFPVGGTLHSFPIGSMQVDFPASPAGTIVAVTLPWTNTADGAHLIQVVAEPGFVQETRNDRATRLIFVGSTPDTLRIDKAAVLVDADENGTPTPGDTLAYTVSYANVGDADLTGAVLLDDYDEWLLETPFDISPAGTVAGGSIVWDLGTLAAHASGTVTYQVRIRPRGEFPAGIVSVVNVALLDTLQTAPVGVEAQIDVLGDMGLRFDFNAFHGYTADGWTGVLPFQLKAGQALGWQTLPTTWFERSWPDAPPYDTEEGELRYDGQAVVGLGNSVTFVVDVVPNLTYEVMILTGDAAENHDQQRFTVSSDLTSSSQTVDVWGAGAPAGGGNTVWGGGVPNTTSTGYYRWVRFTTAVGAGGQLSIAMEDLGGVDPAAVILGLDIRPVETVGELTITRTPPGEVSPFTALEADGATIDSYSGTGAPPGATITVTVSAGPPTQYATITTDNDPTTFGGQVTADATGAFTFSVRRPSTLAGTTSPEPWMVLAEEISGLSRGTATQPYTTPAAKPLRFDFGNYNSPVDAANDFLQVEPRTTYNATRGYGWTTRVASKDRLDTTVTPYGTPPATDLRRDFNYSRNGVFRIDLAANTTYYVRTYHANPHNGTYSFVQGGFEVYANTVLPYAAGNSTLQHSVSGITPGTTDVGIFQVATGADGVLFLDFRSLGSFLISGVEISVGALNVGNEVALQAAGDPLDAGAAAISVAQLQPVMAEAAARWLATGLTPSQTATLASVQFAVADLGGPILGLANPATNQIRIDDDAARFGWSVAGDGLPITDHRSPITGTDLLTVVMHELGHLLGHEHSDDPDDLMAPVLSPSSTRSSSLIPHPLPFIAHPLSLIPHPSSHLDDVFAELGDWLAEWAACDW